VKLLIICPHFEPDLHAATGEVTTQLVNSLAKIGYQVTVVTSLPWYKEHKVESEWSGRPWRTEKTSWGKIIRVWPFPTDKSNIFARAVGFVGFTGLATLRALFAGKHDVVMGMSPPIFLGDAAYIAAKKNRAPFVFNTQDIFPDIAIELNALTNKRVIATAKRYEKSLYKRADAVTVLSSDQQNNVSKKITKDSFEKIKIIHNFVDTNRIKPVDKIGEYRKKHNIENKKVVMYSGNVGLSQSFDLIEQAAKKWENDSSVVFVINGEGAARPQVDGWAKNCPNVLVANFGPREEISSILGAADIHLILLKKGLSASSTPSKLYSILAAGRPVLASVDAGCEVASIIDKANAGVSVAPEDSGQFNDALQHMLDSPKDQVRMAANAREFAINWLSPDHQAKSYDNLFRDIIKG